MSENLLALILILSHIALYSASLCDSVIINDQVAAHVFIVPAEHLPGDAEQGERGARCGEHRLWRIEESISAPDAGKSSGTRDYRHVIKTSLA